MTIPGKQPQQRDVDEESYGSAFSNAPRLSMPTCLTRLTRLSQATSRPGAILPLSVGSTALSKAL